MILKVVKIGFYSKPKSTIFKDPFEFMILK
jgi:hypothetical protein